MMTLIRGLDGCRGYAVQTGKLTLDLSNMRAVQLGARGVATIQAGAKLGPISLVSCHCWVSWTAACASSCSREAAVL